MLVHPYPLDDAELKARLLERPETVWREGEHWRLCRYASAHEAAVLLQNGWELFEGDETDEE